MSNFIYLPVILISFIAFVLCVFYLTARYKRVMLRVCLFFVTTGFMIYTAGYLSSGNGLSEALFAALRGIFSTARMFSFDYDYFVLANEQGTQWLTTNVWLKILLWLCHVSALIIIQTALISLFGRKLMDYFRLRFGLHTEVFIIKGSDKNALMLGENVATHDNPQNSPDAERIVVFLTDDAENAEKIHEKTAHFGGIVRVLDRNQDFSYCLKKTRFGERNWLGKEKTYKIVLTSKNTSALDDALLIANLAKRKGVNSDSLEIFVLTQTEWDREEIETLTQMKNDDGKRTYPYTFHIVNETDLYTRQMVRKHPPFKCPGLNFSDGVAARDFTVLLLGFGTVGQSALLRLVKNGQFFGSRMRAIIVDKNIDDLRDSFFHRYPGLKLCCKFKFKRFDVQCEKFYRLLEKTDYLDYVVVALDSDEANKQAAHDMRLHYVRKDIDTLPFIAVSEKNGALHVAKIEEKMFTFGCSEEIYKEAVIIRKVDDMMAKAVNDTYKAIYGGQSWHELDWVLQESNRAAADFIPAMLYFSGISEAQAMTDGIIAKKDSALAETLSQTEHLRWNAFHAAMGYRRISIEEMRHRFEKSKSLEFARRDAKARLQACLATWDELDAISEAYRELERLAGKKPKRDFKDNDRDIIEYIPKFLKTAYRASHST